MTDTMVFNQHFTIAKLLKFCIGPVCMMILTSLYTIVDGYFVSNYAGATPFAAINLVIPFLMIMGGFGFMFGTGGSALVAKTMGEQKMEKASRIFSIMIEVTVLLGITLSIAGIIFMRPISFALGATEEMIYDCVTYGRVILFFNVFFMLQNVFQAFMSTASRPWLGFLITLAAGLTNMFLDWLFLANFDWGVQGAAIATGIGQMIGGIVPFVIFCRKNDLPLHFHLTPLKTGPIIQASFNGSSELVNNVSSSIVAIAFNMQLLKYVGETGVAVYGVLMYVSMIFVAVSIGYSIGVSPIISYNYGARRNSELKSLLKKSILLNTVTGILMLALCYAIARPLGELFIGYDRQMLDMCIHAFHLFAFCFLFASLNIFFSAFFTALNNGLISAFLSFSRTLVLSLIMVYLLPLFLGVDGIWLSITFSDAGTFLLCLVMLFYQNRNYHYL